MKKIFLGLICLSVLSLAACSSDNDSSKSTDSTSKQETKVSSTKRSTNKEKSKADLAKEKAEKEKQTLIAQKVTDADTKMKAAEANPTDETYAAAKTAVEAIPDGNADLQKRLETVAANLEAVKQQAAANEQAATAQTVSDMPVGWWGTEADWQQAKAQGWTKEDYERQQQASENESNPSVTPNQATQQDPNSMSLTDFVNQYGMSPAAYKVQNGMSREEALQSTPDSQKTSGELQTQHRIEQGLE